MKLVILGGTGFDRRETRKLAAFLAMFAADDSKWITGETLLISGGLP